MKVSGQIFDFTDMSPVPNASVFVSNSDIGVSADKDGVFSIESDLLNDPNRPLDISDIGYKTKSTILYGADNVVTLERNPGVLANVIISAKRAVSKKGAIPAIVIAGALLLLIINYKRILKWSVAGMILLFASCSSVKKVNKDEHKQLQVIDNFQSNHKFKNDTVYYQSGSDTVVVNVYHSDTVEIFNQGQLPKDRVITKTVTVTKTITDTIVQKVTDRSLEYALQAIITDKNAKINEQSVYIESQKVLVEKYKARSFRWLIFFIILLIINTGYILLRLKVL